MTFYISLNSESLCTHDINNCFMGGKMLKIRGFILSRSGRIGLCLSSTGQCVNALEQRLTIVLISLDTVSSFKFPQGAIYIKPLWGWGFI